MFRIFMSTGLAALALLVAPAAASVIDFTAQSLGNNPNPLILPGATFNTIGGFNYVSDDFGSKALCPSTSASSDSVCTRALEVHFDAPSFGLSFAFVANNDETIGNTIGNVQLFAGATSLGSVNMIVIDGSGLTYDLVNLAGFSGVTRLLISDTDAGGLIYDNFNFTSSAVPEPASWKMMIAGIGIAGAAFRRRLRTALKGRTRSGAEPTATGA